jgi:FMN phosphatase YigB (HAD superfamily)
MDGERERRVMVRAVFFDIGETLIDETRLWGWWADWLGVPRLTLFGVLGGVIARGEHHRRALEIVRPGIDVPRVARERAAAGYPVGALREDLYPDAVPCLAALRAEGYLVGVAGNQTAAEEASVRSLGLPVDAVASAGALGAEKPAPAFFAGLAALAGVPPAAVAYVGDRLDNDVLPAAAAGMVAVFLRRGPWGFLHAERAEAARAAIRLDSLAELPDALRPLRAGPGAIAPRRADDDR